VKGFEPFTHMAVPGYLIFYLLLILISLTTALIL